MKGFKEDHLSIAKVIKADVPAVTNGLPGAPLAEGVGHRTPVDIENNKVEADARLHKCKTHNNNLLSTISKRFHLGVDLVAATADPSTHDLDLTKAVGEPVGGTIYLSSDGSERTKGENHEPNRMNPQQPVFDVAPLNCVPYMGPTNPNHMLSSPTKENAEAAEDIAAAATGSMGPLIGKVEIGELEDSYYFRVSLPGISMDKMLIRGISTTGEKLVCKDFQVFHMLTQNLCRPGPFSSHSISLVRSTSYLANGMLEAIVNL
ncbi:hypothetical protein GQ457_03G014480 [Hibiscus cannabinus]